MKNKYVPFVVTAICIIGFIGAVLLLRAFIGRNTFNKAQIIQFVIDNEELLNEAIEEIQDLDRYISRIAHTGFTRLHRGYDFGFEGLYTGGVNNSEYVVKPLDNPILYELLKDGIIRSIGINRPNSYDRRATHQIDFAFNVRGIWDRRGGIYFSRNDVPILFNGRMWGNPEAYMDGWVSYGTNFYYTERILPHWFYYEMVFNSNRTPNR
ncbi:MAG: hypothetical protein FWE42_05460 [Defluviitaleaceae bacterium]|nr:hypothetical protein [Defluviitaleaceae bacterium]